MLRHGFALAFVLCGMLACRSGRSRNAPPPATLAGTWRVSAIEPNPFRPPPAPTLPIVLSASSRFVFSDDAALGVGDGPRNVLDAGLLLMDAYGGVGAITEFQNYFLHDDMRAILIWHWEHAGHDEWWHLTFDRFAGHADARLIASVSVDGARPADFAMLSLVRL